MQAPHSPKQNRLLASLSAEDYQRLLPDLELMPMPLGWAVCEAGGPLGYVYFPTTSIVALLYSRGNGSSAEIAIAGNDGVVGITLFMDGERTPSRAVAHSAGYAFRIKAAALKKELGHGGQLQHLAVQYARTLITQMAQTAVCARHHAVEKQLCRWLLLSVDRLPSNELIVTQDLIAHMLGVRREDIVEAAEKLQADGLIKYARGRITMLNRPQLETRVCACYAVIKRDSDPLRCVGQRTEHKRASCEHQAINHKWSES